MPTPVSFSEQEIQARRQVALRVEVNSKDTLPEFCQGSGQVHGRGGLADTPFLIGERDDMRQRAPSQRALGARGW
jgi:hypothetical protein